MIISRMFIFLRNALWRMINMTNTNQLDTAILLAIVNSLTIEQIIELGVSEPVSKLLTSAQNDLLSALFEIALQARVE